MTSNFIGTWELFESENFEQYMTAIGIDEKMMKVAAANLTVEAKLRNVISVSDDRWCIVTQTPSGEREVKFQMAEEVDTKTLDGRNVKQTTTVEGERMVEVVKGSGFVSRAERYLESPDVMITEFEGNGVKSTRKYKRVA